MAVDVGLRVYYDHLLVLEGARFPTLDMSEVMSIILCNNET